MSAPEKIAYLRSLVDTTPGNEARTQCTRLREALGRYAINTHEARQYLDILHPAGRIGELRNELLDYGLKIVTTREPVITASGKVHWVGRYTLIPGGQA